MSELSNTGYQPKTPDELKELLSQKLRAKGAQFFEYPQTLQGNLQDQSVVYLSWVEEMIARLLNYPALSQDNMIMFALMASQVGLRQKGAYKAEVTLKFTGSQGTIVPKDLQVQDSQGNIFQTEEQVIIGTAGEVFVNAFSDAENIPPIGIGEINQIVLNIAGLSVTNVDTPSDPVIKESDEAFRERVQQANRATLNGSLGKLLAYIKNIAGVDSRQVNWEYQGGGLNLVVGGGNPRDIAYVLYKFGGLNPDFFVSTPSSGGTTRTIQQEISVYGKPLLYKWTIAKIVRLKITVAVAISGVTVNASSVQTASQESMANFINNLQVGISPNIQSLSVAFLEGVKIAGIAPLNINSPQITFTLYSLTDSSNIPANDKGVFTTPFDVCYILSGYEVQING